MRHKRMTHDERLKIINLTSLYQEGDTPMDELVKTVSEETGLPEEKARQAAAVTIDFLKEKLPPPIAKHIDDVLENKNIDEGAAEALKKGMGFLKKK
jgi:uncharacterized protein (DUF2267 family)